MCSSVLCKLEFVSDYGLGQLPENSKISIKDWLMLAAIMRRERREVKKTELFHERNQNLRIWKILSLLRLQK